MQRESTRIIVYSPAAPNTHVIVFILKFAQECFLTDSFITVVATALSADKGMVLALALKAFT
jgi:hypothetical protein